MTTGTNNTSSKNNKNSQYSYYSLNIHDSLTFDGCEICLHPESFRHVQPGDALEIKIWDATTTNTVPLHEWVHSSTADTTAATSTNTPAPPHPDITHNESSSSIHLPAPITTTTSPGAPTEGPGSVLVVPPPTVLSNTPTTVSASMTTDPFPLLPPRSRTSSTIDRGMPHPQTQPPPPPLPGSSSSIATTPANTRKPPIQTRRSVTHTAPTTSATNSPSTTPKASSSSLQTRHSRDVSDMTSDTFHTTTFTIPPDFATPTISTPPPGTTTNTMITTNNSVSSSPFHHHERTGSNASSSHLYISQSEDSGMDDDSTPAHPPVPTSVSNNPKITTTGASTGVFLTNHRRSTTPAPYYQLRLSFIMKVQPNSLTAMVKQQQRKYNTTTQVSLLRNIADLYHLSSYDFCTIHKIDLEEETAALDFVLVTIKDQFVSRGDMYRFQTQLWNSWVYQGQRLHLAGVQAHARELRDLQAQPARSGIITKDTKITVRSRSARFVWLVQMSAEMWDYSSPWEDKDGGLCQLYFDKFISFVHELFAKWKTVEATHSLTVVFFSRTLCSEGDTRDVYGRPYEDHFRVVLENETRTDWESLVPRLKEAFLRYPVELGWNLNTEEHKRTPSSASQGNLLEAINVTLNVLQFHYFDRDLHRTGNSILVVSAGGGVFEVDKGLASITYQRMMDNGIGSDMLSLGLPPLHIAPFFLYNNNYQNNGDVDASESYYEVPHWMHLSFVTYESRNTIIEETKSSTNEAISSFDVHTPGDLQVGSNGFILASNFEYLQKATALNSPPRKMKGSFSLYGSGTVSPPQERIFEKARHLIADRDFSDILEACRPRISGIIPTALRAIIRQNVNPRGSEEAPPSPRRVFQLDNEREKSNESIQEEEKMEPHDALASSPKEWGALELSSRVDGPKSPGRMVIAAGKSPGKDSSPLLPPMIAVSPPQIDLLDRTKEVIASSFGSNSQQSSSRHSSTALGVSYDKIYMNQLSTLQSGTQLQRPPSLEFDEDSVDILSDDSISWGVLGNQEERKDQRKEEREKAIDRITKTMRNFDDSVLKPELPTKKSEPGKSKGNLRGDGQMKRTISGREESGRTLSGGVGAAITQHRMSSGGNDNANSMLRVASAGVIQPPGPSSFSRLSQSPLLLPPGAFSSSMAEISEGIQRASSVNRLKSDYFASLVRRDSTGVVGRVPGTINMNSRAFFKDKFTMERNAYSVGRSGSKQLSSSPPTRSALSSLFAPPSPTQTSSAAPEIRPQQSRGESLRVYGNSKRKKAFNPFREEDEDEVLAKKSHNRRRWSHVFPLGEIEFKRHAGPNWKSLSSPAILPLSIDYFPPQNEIDHNFTFSISNVTIADLNSKFASNKEFLFQMVAQRLTQDYQLVPPSHVNASNYKRESLRTGHTIRERSNSIHTEDEDAFRVFMSMGHSLQVLTYDTEKDTVEVTTYNAIDTQRNAEENTQKYFYRAWCDETNSFKKMSQEFSKYSERYNWNKVDRILGGDDDRELRDGMRFRRLMFAILPERWSSKEEEQSYIAKFQRLLEYFKKLREKGSTSDEFKIKIVSSEIHTNDESPSHGTYSTPGLAKNSMEKFYIDLSKNKRDSANNYGWFEVSVDSTFDTRWTYRIMYSWLVTGSGQMDPQVQLLQRRCTQYGLNLVQVPQVSVSRNIFLNSFKAPFIFTVHDPDEAAELDDLFLRLEYIHDGVFYTDALSAMECVHDSVGFDFGKRWSMPPAGRQFLHRSGTLFARIMNDRKGRAVIVIFGNHIYIHRDPTNLRPEANKAYKELMKALASLNQSTS